jgi:adenine-specific DNA methylase
MSKRYCKKLIEVALPLEDINGEAARESPYAMGIHHQSITKTAKPTT